MENDQNKEAVPPKPEPWQHSLAKKLLEQDILDGTVSDTMPPRLVYTMRPEYAEYKKERFSANLRALKQVIKAKLALANEDYSCLRHDLDLNLRTNSKQYPRWQGGAAAKLLEEDINAGKHLQLKPSELQLTRPEYQDYPKKVFRDHLYQALRAMKGRPYWMARARGQLPEPATSSIPKLVKPK